MKLSLLNYLILFTFLLFIGCGNSKTPSEVQRVIELAGDNKKELQAVLSHYKKDKQKFRAACFLIRNMRYHKSKQQIEIPDQFPKYLVKTDSLYHTLFNSMSSEDILLSKPKKQDEIRKEFAVGYSLLPLPVKTDNDKSDLEILSAQFLIEHIDGAFARWKESPLLKSLNFDDFKEFILPYRSTNEELAFTQQELYDIWADVIGQDGFHHIEAPLARYKAVVNKNRWINHYTKPVEKAAMYDLFFPKFKMDCHNMTNWSVRILRACGIPAVYEYTPQWKDRDSRHFWCVSPDSTGVWLPYTAPDNNIKEDWESDIQFASKVYRRTFAAHKNTPYFIANEFEYIPEELNSPLLSDQTFRYHQTVTLCLPLKANIETNLVYLCLFKGGDINPVGWGTVDRTTNGIVFEQLPLNTVFIPIYYNENEEAVPLCEPFLIQSQEMHPDIPPPLTVNKLSKVKTLTLTEKGLIERGLFRDKLSDLNFVSFKPNNGIVQDILLSRKYPEKRRLKKMREQLVGAFFTGSMEEKRGYDTLYTLDTAPVPYLQQIKLNNINAYRYYRFWTNNGSPVNIAHMEFLGNEENNIKGLPSTQLPILDPSHLPANDDKYLSKIVGQPLPTGSNPEYAFDGDPATYVGSSGIGVDFGREVVISHIRFMPRTANNGVVVGHEYQLMYHNGKQWAAHETQIANENYLRFEKVPSGTLYWLRNLTEGKEELPFLFKDGEQLFIHVDSF